MNLKRIIVTAAFAALTALPLGAETFEQAFPGHPGYENEEAQAILNSFEYRLGEVTVGDDLARMALGDAYYFLGVQDARTVLETIWGNPEDPEVLGMVFPRGLTPLDGAAWGLVITFDPIGYVSDEDAASIDYDALLKDMQADADAANEYRVENGFERIELVGWAAPPKYDAADRKLHWAKELHFEGVEGNTLNYNLRVLGRRGVLQMNFVAGMDQLTKIQREVPAIMAVTNFTPGNTYADFNPDIDTVAAVGIGGLIAGKVLTNTGMLAVALVFLKKFWFVLLIPLMWLGRFFKGRTA